MAVYVVQAKKSLRAINQFSLTFDSFLLRIVYSNGIILLIYIS
jgi:hypothetical protein